jgi:structural maintenance of chromosome 3 (chondroitin sulfate proteoglycan 6)
MEKESDKLHAEAQELRNALEKVQTQQSEDSKGISRQQKNTERYLAKRQMLLTRKDECNSNIRDLGVLPEEAFEKYVNEKLDRVRQMRDSLGNRVTTGAYPNDNLACEEASDGQ